MVARRRDSNGGGGVRDLWVDVVYTIIVTGLEEQGQPSSPEYLTNASVFYYYYFFLSVDDNLKHTHTHTHHHCTLPLLLSMFLHDN